jgi:hypothetical protein
LPQLVVGSWLQVPLPLQNDGGWYVKAVHDMALPHATVVGCCWQAPVPLQAPVLPHGGAAVQRACGSVVPDGTLPQVPGPVRPLALHTWQVGQLETAQQTPSTQLPLTHWLTAPQAAPFTFFATQLPPEQ